MEKKELLFAEIEKNSEKLLEMSDFIHDNPECDGQEVEASKLLTKTLQEEGFAVETGCGGLPTAFRAVYENRPERAVSSGQIPRIGILCEYDALEGLGHGCGHHMQGPACLGAAFAVKNGIKELPYDLIVYGTPAEETFGGKINMLKAGCFQDIDLALMMHGAPDTCTDIKCLALSTFDVVFHGKSAHAALAPENGRSAFDAMLLAFQGMEYLREHVKEDTRMHYTITELPGPENVVPARAAGKFTLRSYSRDYLDQVVERFEEIIKGAAMMGGVTYEIHAQPALDNKIPVFLLNDLMMENAKLIQAPEIAPPREKTGSTDFGNVMHVLPGACIRVQFVPKGTSSHSQAYVDAGKTEAAHQCVLNGAKILAGTAYDLISDPQLVEQIKEEFIKNKEIYQ